MTEGDAILAGFLVLAFPRWIFMLYAFLIAAEEEGEE